MTVICKLIYGIAEGKDSLGGPETELKSTQKLPVAVLADAYPFRATPDEKLARGGTAGELLAVSALRRSVGKVTTETPLRGERGQKRTAAPRHNLILSDRRTN